MRDAGLNFLAVSVDSADPAAMRELRGGTSVKKVYRNVEAFHKTCPEVRVAFITTVTARNIDLIRPLIVSGLEVGISTFNLRQVSYNLSNDIVDHSRMSALVVSDDAFDAMAEAIKSEFGKRAHFAIQSRPALRALATATRAASGIADDRETRSEPPRAACECARGISGARPALKILQRLRNVPDWTAIKLNSKLGVVYDLSGFVQLRWISQREYRESPLNFVARRRKDVNEGR
jgi:hypothetical protein